MVGSGFFMVNGFHRANNPLVPAAKVTQLPGHIRQLRSGKGMIPAMHGGSRSRADGVEGLSGSVLLFRIHMQDMHEAVDHGREEYRCDAQKGNAAVQGIK